MQSLPTRERGLKQTSSVELAHVVRRNHCHIDLLCHWRKRRGSAPSSIPASDHAGAVAADGDLHTSQKKPGPASD